MMTIREGFNSIYTTAGCWAAAYVGVNWLQAAEAVKNGLTLAGVCVASGLAVLTTVDRWRINRRAEYDAANKISLSAQLERQAEQLADLAEHVKRSDEARRQAEAEARAAEADAVAAREQSRKRIHDVLNAENTTGLFVQNLQHDIERLTATVVELSRINAELMRGQGRIKEAVEAQPTKVAEAIAATVVPAVKESLSGSTLTASPHPEG
jgi:hypothetical protein